MVARPECDVRAGALLQENKAEGPNHQHPRYQVSATPPPDLPKHDHDDRNEYGGEEEVDPYRNAHGRSARHIAIEIFEDRPVADLDKAKPEQQSGHTRHAAIEFGDARRLRSLKDPNNSPDDSRDTQCTEERRKAVRLPILAERKAPDPAARTSGHKVTQMQQSALGHVIGPSAVSFQMRKIETDKCNGSYQRQNRGDGNLATLLKHEGGKPSRYRAPTRTIGCSDDPKNQKDGEKQSRIPSDIKSRPPGADEKERRRRERQTSKPGLRRYKCSEQQETEQRN